MNSLFQGLREDNERLASEIQTITKDNQLLKEHVENQKLVVAQQSGIIKGLQSILENTITERTNPYHKTAASATEADLAALVSEKRVMVNRFEDTGNFDLSKQRAKPEARDAATPRDNSNTSQKFDPQIIYTSLEN